MSFLLFFILISIRTSHATDLCEGQMQNTVNFGTEMLKQSVQKCLNDVRTFVEREKLEYSIESAISMSGILQSCEQNTNVIMKTGKRNLAMLGMNLKLNNDSICNCNQQLQNNYEQIITSLSINKIFVS